MATLFAKGIRLDLPPRFEGRIYQRPSVAGATSYPVVHAATFPLSSDFADFGGGATVGMQATDIFTVLFEYGPESVGRALFARSGPPTALGPNDFYPYLLRRGVGGQSGTQWFFTESGRPFTFYAVLGSHALRATLAPEVNTLLKQLTVLPASAASLSS